MKVELKMSILLLLMIFFVFQTRVAESIPEPINVNCDLTENNWIVFKSLGGSTQVEGAIISFQDRLIIAVKGDDNKPYVMEWNLTSQTQIGYWYVPNGRGSTCCSPKLVLIDGKPHLYVQGNDGYIYFSVYLSPGNWTEWKNSGVKNEYFGSSGPNSTLARDGKIYGIRKGSPIYLIRCDRMNKVITDKGELKDGFGFPEGKELSIGFVPINKPAAIHYKGKYDRTYIAYHDVNANPKIFYYDHKEKYFSEPVKVGETGITWDDDHGAPAIAIDKNGYIHIFYGSHSTPLLYQRSIYPEDIRYWTKPAVIDNITTYPLVFVTNDNKIFVFYRGVDKSPFNSSQLVAVEKFVYSTDGGNSWSSPKTLINFGGCREPRSLFYGGLDCGIYHIGVALGNEKINQSIHIAWSYYDEKPTLSDYGKVLFGFGYGIRRNVYYAVSRDGGVTWTTSNGRVLNLPITIDEAEKVYDSGLNFTHGYDLKLDEKNNPYILFISNLTYKIAKFSPERGWEISEITISDEYGGSGYQNWDTGALDVVNSSYIEAYLIVGGEPKRRGGELQRWASYNGGKTWEKVEDITFNSNGLHNNPQVVVNYSPELKVVWAFVPKNDSSASIIKTYPFELSYALSDECKNPWPYAYLGGRAKSQPIIIEWNNSLIVAVQGMDDSVWIKEWNITSLTRWYRLSGATIAPPRFSIEENTLWIYVKGKDGNVYKACYIERGKWCNWQKTGKSNIEFGKFGPIATNSFFVFTDENSRIYIGTCTGKPKEWEPPEWIKDLIIYEINPKTFTSPNGPGTGTFKSLKEKLPYLHELGITAIWLAGYSLSDPHHFFNIWTQYACIDPSRIDPSLGSEEDFRDLIQEAHKYGIKVFLDVITHGVMNYSHLVKEHPDWFSGSSWRMIDYNWGDSPPELEQWWVNVWTRYVLDFGVDGFRLDVGHVRWDLWARIKENVAKVGHPIVIFSELEDTHPGGIGVKIGVYDFSQQDLSVGDFSYEYNKYINVKNISSNSLLNLDKSRKYYILLLSCHDNGWGLPPWPQYNPYQLRGSRFKLGYSFIFTPFIPLFFAGEEFNATYNEIPDKVGHGCFPEDPPTNWLYSSQILWNELEIPEKKEFFETFKKAISIRKNEKALTYFSNPPNLINPKKWEPSSLPIPYIRWYENTSILVVGNPTSTPVEVKLEFPVNELGYVSYDFFKLTDLFSEKEELKYKNEILNFATIVQPDNFRIFKIEPIIPSLVVNTINKIEEKHVNYQPIQKFVFHTKGGINNGVIYIEKIENLTILPSNILTHTSFKILERNISENIDYVEIVFRIEKDWIKKK